MRAIRVSIFVVVLFLAACSAAKTIVMKNPQTGAIQQCINHDLYIGRGPADSCAEALERDGWIRLNP